LTCNLTSDFRVLNVSTQRCQAMQGYFDNLITVAVPCNSSCVYCMNLTFCTQCQDGYFFTKDNLCSAQCEVRYFAEVPTKTCKSCLFDCYTCKNSQACLSCNQTTDFRILNANTSRCVPLPGYYDNSTTVSVQCPVVCNECSSAKVCSACSNSNYLRFDNYCYARCLTGTFADNFARKCLSCPSKCLSCLSAAVCTECVVGAFLRIDKLCYS